MAVFEVNNGNFEEMVLKSDVPVLVDFWAPWCAPCHVMTPILQEFAGEFEGQVKVGKLNVDDNREIAVKYGITGIPTMILFSNGEAVQKIVGVTQKDALTGQLNPYISG